MNLLKKIRDRVESFIIHKTGAKVLKKLKHNQDQILSSLAEKKKISNVIVSFTTYEKRIDFYEDTILSIVNGNVLPEFICIYVAESMHSLMKQKSSLVFELEKMGIVKIRIVEDLKSYKKIVFALQDFPEKDIVICDDDVLYTKNWLQKLVDTHKKIDNKKTVICHRCHHVLYNKDGSFKKYIDWQWNIVGGNASKDNFATGIGGVLYPSGSLPAIAADKNLFMQLAPSADDIWLWFCAINNGYKIVRANSFSVFRVIPGTEETGLRHTNVAQDINDQQIFACYKYFNNGVI